MFSPACFRSSCYSSVTQPARVYVLLLLMCGTVRCAACAATQPLARLIRTPLGLPISVRQRLGAHSNERAGCASKQQVSEARKGGTTHALFTGGKDGRPKAAGFINGTRYAGRPRVSTRAGSRRLGNSVLTLEAVHLTAILAEPLHEHPGDVRVGVAAVRVVQHHGQPPVAGLEGLALPRVPEHAGDAQLAVGQAPQHDQRGRQADAQGAAHPAPAELIGRTAVEQQQRAGIGRLAHPGRHPVGPHRRAAHGARRELAGRHAGGRPPRDGMGRRRTQQTRTRYAEATRSSTRRRHCCGRC
ncbi:hypothetical protein HPB48_025906 [Haemaphysalis longicornis]|uniref:Uncharacterized protein n=1 Tax=Haemaphysalis longicornis TaxID=44386 RepID=A0A9J6GZT3_HAELO|nr:hypothetical protein HPB48_025906 [Haemaphysalis longicornis]